MMMGYQTARVDVNGDGEANKQNRFPEIKIGREYTPASDIPFISAVSPAQTLYGKTSAKLWASDIIDANGVREVWATIIGPDFDPGPPDVPITDLSSEKPEKLKYSAENKRYEVTYDKFDKLGPYRVSIFATDNDDMTSLPKSTIVY